MPDNPPEAPITNVISSFFQTGIYRYSRLLKKYWWILFLCGSAGLFFQAWNALRAEPSYSSVARMIVSGQIAMPNSQSYREEVTNFFGTETRLMESSEVRNRAVARVQAIRPELRISPVAISATQDKGTSIFVLSARGAEPQFTQAILDAVMEEYLAYKRDSRLTKADTARSSIADELTRLDKQLRASRDALIEFQRQNNLPAIEEAGNDAARYLAELKRELAGAQNELKLLDLLDLDQNIERRREQAAKAALTSPAEGQPQDPAQSVTAVTPTTLLGPESQYLATRQQIAVLRTERDQWAKTHRPQHPRMQAIDREIGQAEGMLEIYKSQAVEQLASKRRALQLQIQNLEEQIKDWEQRALEVSRSKAEYERLRADVQHLEQQWTQYSTFSQSMETVGTVGTEMVSIMERASPAVEMRPPFVRALLIGIFAGLLAGCVILFIIDRLDDRMNSQSEFEGRFSERVIGQIPQIDIGTASTILQVNDPRHSFAEAFRNVRSSIHFMPLDGSDRPRSFVVTSATPNEGKTTTSSNLAVTMAYAGQSTLLVDADLRRGTVHEQFLAQSTPGLTEVLEGRHTWQELALKTNVPNLHLVTRGRTINEAGQLFMSSSFDSLLAEMLKHYDVVIFDTPPVLAADDTTSLAPKLDATIFVVRLSQTLARQSRKALDLLYERQANVIGVILNCADPTMPEYKYYYQYSQYYYHNESGEKPRKRKSAAA